MLLYLHGFRSSPRSIKSSRVAARMAELGRAAEFICPQLPVAPAEAAALILSIARERGGDNLAVVGSSLGGFYATWLAEQTGCRAVLINPAVRPDRDLQQYLGPQTVYHSDETVDIRPEFIDQLHELRVPAITRPERYLLIAATGDEVLDWREMVAHYPGAHQHIIEGGDHGLADFDPWLDMVLRFAGIHGDSPAGR